jgi:hypothetical protein
VDVFVFYDCVQYDDRGWRNRNQIKTREGLKWLTIPVNSKGAQTHAIPINRIPIVWDSPWDKKHLAAITHSYSKAPHFQTYLPLLEEFYRRHDIFLADFTCKFTQALSHELGIQGTHFVRSSTLPAVGVKTERLLSILNHLGADHYVSGPSASAYLDMNRFADAGIAVEYMVYDYPQYTQLHGEFAPNVSILDSLFMLGPETGRYIWKDADKF